MNTPAATLSEVLAVLNPEPLRIEELDKYFIETSEARGTNVALRLKAYFSANAAQPKHVLLMGHRSSGKSTELAAFAKQATGFRVIAFSIREEADIYDLNHVDLVFTMLRKLFEAAKQDDIAMDPSQLLRLDRFWNSEQLLEELKIQKSDYEGTAQVGGGLWSILSASIKGVLHYGTESKKTVRSFIRPRIGELTENINSLLQDLRLKYREKGLTPIVVVEDLDKMDLDVARELFLNHTNTLTSFKVHVIYTFPIFLNYSNEAQHIGTLFDQKELLSMIKVRDRQGNPYPLGRQIIREIIAKRADLALFEDQALEFLIDKSGGCLRHLFEMLQNAVLEAVISEHNPQRMGMVEAEKGYRLLRNSYERNLTPEQLIALKKLHKSKDKTGWNDETNQALLNTMAVIEYNGERWCGIHPVVVDLLHEKGQLGKSR